MSVRFFGFASAIFITLNYFAIVNSELGKLSYCDRTERDSQQSSLYISTLDGKISAIDLLKGNVKWTLGSNNKPLLSSSIHRRELNNNGQWVKLIPSLKGTLYKFDGDNIEFVPVTAEQLLKSSFRYSDDLVFSGGKETNSYGILSSTGKLVYECSIGGCKNATDDENYNKDDVLVVQRYQHTVRAIDARSGIERWNFSVGEHDLSLIRNLNFDCSIKKDLNSTDIQIKVIIPEGLIWALNISNPLVKLWEYKFESPIVSVWREIENTLHDGNIELKEVNLFDNSHWTSDFASNPALYIAMHEKQLYIQENPIFDKHFDPYLFNSANQLSVFPWRPYPVIAFDETDTVVNNKDLAVVSTETQSTTAISVLYNSEYINGNGFYLYSNEQLHLPENSQCNKTVIDGINFTEERVLIDEETPVQIIIVSIWYYWKEIFVISFTTAVILNCMIDSKLNFLRRKVKETVLEVPVADGYIENVTTEERKISISEDDMNFSSRFLTDFDPIICLGKGGFGIVFEAKNKIDDCHYAIKRITLPNSQDSRDRVMREVKALAKLEHQNIVRYFNAWLECPPIGWQEEQDEILHKKGIISKESEYTQELTQTETETDTNLNDSYFDSNTKDASLSSAFEAQEISDYDDDDFIQFKYSEDGVQKDVQLFDNVSIKGTKKYDVSSDENDKGLIMKNKIKPKNIDEHTDDSVIFEYTNSEEKKNVSKRNYRSMCKVLEVNSIIEEKPKIRLKAPRMYLYIQMQLCQRKSLRDWLKHCEKPRDLKRAVNIFQQIVDAVEYVHLKGLIHRDLKPSNIFFAFDDKIKIGDFGLVTAMPDSISSPVQLDGLKVKNEQSKSEVIHTAEVGTQLYMSPEQMNGKIYNYKVDIYSLGIILFELLTPFCTDMERINCLTNLRRSVFPENFASHYPAEFDLLKIMLEHDPKKRPTTLGIKARPPLYTENSSNKACLISDDQWHFDLPALSRHSSTSNTESNSSENTVL